MVFPPIPEAPSDFSAYPTAYNQIDLSWQDNSNVEEGYKIERGTSPTQFSVIATEETPCGTFPMNYKDRTCSMGTTYYYRVKAYNSTGHSYSNTVSATIPTGSPAAPSSLQGHFEYGPGAVELTWYDNSNNEQGTAIERKSEYEPWWQEIDRVGPNVTSYEDSNVDPDTFYYYRVRAYNPYGYSSYSNTKRVYVPWY